MKSHVVKKGLIVVGLVVLCTALFSQFSVAAQMDGSKSIAKMLLGLEHRASDADKAMLMEIANDSSSSEAIRKIAMVLHSFEHRANEADKEALTAIAGDGSATDAERTLAGIVAETNHRVSEEAKAKLEALE